MAMSDGRGTGLLGVLPCLILHAALLSGLGRTSNQRPNVCTMLQRRLLHAAYLTRLRKA